MKNRILSIAGIFLLLFLSFILSVASAIAAETGSNVGNIAPDFEVEILDGGDRWKLSDYRGKKAVWLVFWATWCPNCAREIPKLAELHERYKDKVEILGVNVTINDSLKKIGKFRGTHAMPYKLAFDRKATDLYEVVGTPTQVVIDIQGVIRYRGADVPDGLADQDIEGLRK